MRRLLKVILIARFDEKESHCVVWVVTAVFRRQYLLETWGSFIYSLAIVFPRNGFPIARAQMWEKIYVFSGFKNYI